jgi:cobalt/nickel transport system permease protein
MGIAGPFVAYLIWLVFRRTRLPASVGVFIAVALADLTTYAVTAFQLALAFPTAGSVFDSFLTFAGIYAVTQIPLAIGEAILAVLIFSFLAKYKRDLLVKLKVLKIPVPNGKQEVE